jgi:iron complex outermembrane recepter protein
MPAKGFGGNEFHCRCFMDLNFYTMKQVFILLAFICTSLQLNAQFSLKGKVKGSDNEFLIGAHVIIRDTYYQTTTNKEGEFVFNGMKSGTYQLIVSFVGYEKYSLKMEVTHNTELEILLKESPRVSDAVIISAVRATENTPTTFSIINKEQINQKNQVQDLPYILNLEPSVVTTSDAGSGVGYTGLRIRGNDLTRVNVTINGIPLNDPESHAVYWVDIPDIASSVNSLQMQRGVGSSTNGAGAFGASMNLETNTFQTEPFGAISLSAGSFNTLKSVFQTGTGLIKDHWYFEGRGSAIRSDGYIDRASSTLNSFFMQGGYYNERTLVKAVVFGGNEKTYQAWYGTDAQTLKSDRTFNWAGVIFDKDGSIRYYDKQTDNYRQNHYQIHVSRRLSTTMHLNISGHYTYGSGYYEEYCQNESFEDYGLNNLYFGMDSVWDGGSYKYFYHDTIYSTDLIRQRWLDNHYYGVTWSVRNQKGKTDLTIGGSFHKYDKARHFGKIIWAEYYNREKLGEEYYNNTSFKTDFNLFVKASWSPVLRMDFYGDLQYRHIVYKAGGIESHLNMVDIHQAYDFFNPKIGLGYDLNMGTLYASYGIAHREPIRDDFIDALPGEKPKPEWLGDLEVGIRKTDGSFVYAANYFLMSYVNQLVLTGAINDDGAYIRKNAGKSYRMGIEVSGAYKFNTRIEASGNLAFNISKTDYKQAGKEGQIEVYHNSDISFSPRLTTAAQIKIFPVKNLEINWMIKFVGKQYLDNTGNRDLMLDSYVTHDVRFGYLFAKENLPEMEFTLLMNNMFNSLYESNGFVYEQTPYYYPQAGMNYLVGLNVKF